MFVISAPSFPSWIPCSFCHCLFLSLLLPFLPGAILFISPHLQDTHLPSGNDLINSFTQTCQSQGLDLHFNVQQSHWAQRVKPLECQAALGEQIHCLGRGEHPPELQERSGIGSHRALKVKCGPERNPTELVWTGPEGEMRKMSFSRGSACWA